MKKSYYVFIPLLGLGLYGGFLWYEARLEQQAVLDRGERKAAQIEASTSLEKVLTQAPVHAGTKDQERIETESAQQVAANSDLDEAEDSPEGDENAFGVPDRTIQKLWDNNEARRQFLAKHVLKSLDTWQNADDFPHEKFVKGDMIGQFSGPLDGGKGTVYLRFFGRVDEDGVFKGRVIVKMLDAYMKRISENLTFTATMTNRLRVDPSSKALVLNAHDDAPYMVQIFRGSSDKYLIGNVYKKDKGTSTVQLFASYKAEREPPPVLKMK